jgi:hypothetical protein
VLKEPFDGETAVRPTCLFVLSGVDCCSRMQVAERMGRGWSGGVLDGTERRSEACWRSGVLRPFAVCLSIDRLGSSVCVVSGDVWVVVLGLTMAGMIAGGMHG